MTRLLRITVAASALFSLAFAAATTTKADPLPDFSVLETAGAYAILAGTTVTNTGTSVITGNIGVSPGSAVTGTASIVLTGTIHKADAVAVQAQSDLGTAYGILANLVNTEPTTNLSGDDLAGKILTAGVYQYNSSAGLTGTLTFDAEGNSDAVFIIVIGSTLTTGDHSSIELLNGARASNIFFVVGSSATIGTYTDFAGQILALTDITLTTGATIDCGAALAQNGQVSLDTNTINICTLAVAPGTFGGSLGPTATDNEHAVGGAIDDYITGGDTPPLGFQVLPIGLSEDELAAAYTALSGEAGTAVAPAGIQAMNSFLSLVLDSWSGDNRSGPSMITSPGRNTVRALGYASEDPRSKAASALASLDPTPLGGIPGPRDWDIWVSAYGGENNTDGNSSVGSHDRTTDTYGVATGLDYRITPDTRVGFAVGGGGMDFGVSDDLGGGHSDMVQAAIYSRTDFGAAYVAGALAYAYYDVSTDRYLPANLGAAHLSAAFSAEDVAGQIEAGYRFGWFIPYGALRVQAFDTPSYSEQVESGTTTFPLDYEARTTTMVRTELGTKIEQTVPLDHGASLALRARAAWAHDYWSNSSVVAMFQTLPGPTFTVEGAAPATDSLLLSAGAQINLSNGFSIAGQFDGEFASGSETYAGIGRLSYAW